MTPTEQTDAEFLRETAGVGYGPFRAARLRAIADRLEAEDKATPTAPVQAVAGNSGSTFATPVGVPAPSLPALLTECPDCFGTGRRAGLDVKCPDCRTTGRILTPAGEQVAELVKWVR